MSLSNRHGPVPLLVAALLALTMALGACGSDDSSTAPDEGSTDAGGITSTTLEPGDATTIPELPENDDPAAVQCTAPPEGIFDATAIVGEPVADAKEAAQAKGCEVRVVEEDGKPLAGTLDYRPDRVNVVVVDGDVTAIDSLG